MNAPVVPRLLLLTDRSQLRLGRGLVRTVAECVGVGLTHVVVRELDLSRAQRAALAVALSRTGVQVIAAREPLPGTVGVHLGAVQPSGGAWFGRSCHGAEEVRRAAAEGAAYVTLSPYAATDSKPGHGPPIDRGDLGGHGVPVLALGGIGADNARAAREAGAHGVAVMGAVMRSADPVATVARLLEEVR